MRFEVEIQAWGDLPPRIRTVEVPDEQYRETCIAAAKPTRPSQDVIDAVLDLVFHYGQNDFQPVSGCQSVSVGDVIRLGEGRFKVIPVGFERVS